ncbi:DUF72 domain-containing protein [Vagococcus sp. PNs007]|uniref:DUF72 domain-containing protein n=1 Tax=Vagococcus proximus TaxID=2991417 RepID=A0ABT5X0H8_9ENTE|nr:DUF72 domain-containing protein [Vagococcus proximus]MDF0479484.1 DUF72 domain-containing protein [Vagococcus proximus]
MIRVGLTSWGEHPILLNKENITLAEYASVLPIVELDTPFYGIPSIKTVNNWIEATPSDFKFIIKAHQCMTTHRPWQDFFESEKALYEKYIATFMPLLTSGKLGSILLQFPATFACTESSVIYLRRLRKILKGWPLSVEFRHPSWYDEQNYNQMCQFMRDEVYSLLTIDEPQVQNRSVPFDTVRTVSDYHIFRFHGRNPNAWVAKGEDWRKKRTLYRYNDEELTDLATHVKATSESVEDVYVIFNNNSGGDAGASALTFTSKLNLVYDNLNPKQLDLFSE